MTASYNVLPDKSGEIRTNHNKKRDSPAVPLDMEKCLTVLAHEEQGQGAGSGVGADDRTHIADMNMPDTVFLF